MIDRQERDRATLYYRTVIFTKAFSAAWHILTVRKVQDLSRNRETMKKTIQSVDQIAAIIRNYRKAKGLTQSDLAAASALGTRFVGDLERGKPTCEIGKTIHLLNMLGIELEINVRDSNNE